MLVLGKVAGWGFTSKGGALTEELKVVSLPFVTRLSCIEDSLPEFREFVTPDKLCAGFTNGTTVCKGDSGGGLVFSSNGRYYLRGIVSTKPSGDLSCNPFALATFTRVLAHQGFILNRYRASELGAGTAFKFLSGTDTCTLPPLPEHGTYTVNESSVVPGSVLSSAILQVECEIGYRFIPEDASENATFVDGGAVACNLGRWQYKQMPLCELECGRASSSDNGQLSPWRAQVYFNNEYRCEATLVRLDAVITSAVCVVEFINYSTARFLDEQNLKVSVARQSSKGVKNSTEVMVLVQNTCKLKDVNFCVIAEGYDDLSTGSGLVCPVSVGNETRYFLRGVVTPKVTRNKVFVSRRFDKMLLYLTEQLARKVKPRNNYLY